MEKLTYDKFIHNLRNKIPFSFSRFGDGEIRALLQMKPNGKNCDGHRYFKDMGNALADVLLWEPEYYIGLQPLSQKVYGSQFDRWQKLNGLDLNWSNADILHNASMEGRLSEMFEALYDRKVIYVGPPSLIKISKYIKYKHFVNVLKTLKALLYDKYENWVVLFSASMPTEVWIDDMYKWDEGNQHSFIDVGSLFDPYVDRNSRKYHLKLDLPEHKERVWTR